MQKLNKDFVKYSFAGEGSVKEYSNAITDIGLWASEKILFEKYFKRDLHIIEVGCGTGRVSFGMRALGYHNIVGLDLSEHMLAEAQRFNAANHFNLSFMLGDATALPFEDSVFDGAIFAFNGLMQIPGKENRVKALCEINRVIKPGSIFIFTTHDRDADKKYEYYWEQEVKLWAMGKQNPKLLEFGDLVYSSYDREMFVHIPKRSDIITYLNKSGFELIEDLFRPEIANESLKVKEFSDECRFWVVRKP